MIHSHPSTEMVYPTYSPYSPGGLSKPIQRSQQSVPKPQTRLALQQPILPPHNQLKVLLGFENP